MTPGSRPKSGRNVAIVVLCALAVLCAIAWFVTRDEHGSVQPDPAPSAATESAPDLASPDTTLVASSREATRTTEAEEIAVAAPIVPEGGERVDANGKPVFEITGIAVDADANPLANTKLEWGLAGIVIGADKRESGGGNVGSAPVETDPSGRFVIQTRKVGAMKSGYRELSLATKTARGRRVVECIESPRCDVGIVMLTGPRVLFAGVVVDSAGKPITDAVLSTTDRAYDMGSDVARFGFVEKVRTDESGRFVVRGHTSSPVLTLWVTNLMRGYVVFENEPIPNVGMRIVLPDADRPFLRLNLDIADPDCREGVMVWATPPELPASNGAIFLWHTADGAWQSGALYPPGLWDIEVRVLGETVVRLDDVDLPPTGPSLDARLDRIDARELVDCVRLRFVSSAGVPVSGAKFLVTSWNCTADADGWARVAKPASKKVMTKDVTGAEVEVVDGATIRVVE